MVEKPAEEKDEEKESKKTGPGPFLRLLTSLWDVDYMSEVADQETLVRKTFRELIIYLIFLIFVCMIAFGMASINMYFLYLINIKTSTQITSMTDPWSREDMPFNYSATGYLGKKRPDMLTNRLLERQRLGRARQPPESISVDTVYGDTYRCPFTVANAMAGWAGSSDPHEAERSRPLRKGLTDFFQYNLGATWMGLTTKEEVKAYRKTRKRLPLMSLDDMSQERPRPVDPKPGAVYGGKTVRHKETMSELITHVYRKDWIAQRKQGEEQKRLNRPIFTEIKSNLATQLRHMNIGRDKTSCHCPRTRLPRTLQSVKSQLSTFRSDSARQKAMEAHEMEMIERNGNPFTRLHPNEKISCFPDPPKDLHLRPKHRPCRCSSFTVEEKAGTGM